MIDRTKGVIERPNLPTNVPCPAMNVILSRADRFSMIAISNLNRPPNLAFLHSPFDSLIGTTGPSPFPKLGRVIRYFIIILVRLILELRVKLLAQVHLMAV